MFLRMAKTGIVTLIALGLPLSRGLAQGGGAPASRPDDQAFRQFWQTGVSGLEQWAPSSRLAADGNFDFQGYQGQIRTAVCTLPPDEPQGVVLHLTDAPTAQPVTATDGRLHCVFAWRDGALEGPLAEAETRLHPLYGGVLDACRLTQLLWSLHEYPERGVRLVGEGYGATIALAVAALEPRLVSSVVAHQPVCVASALRAQAARQGVAPDLPPEALDRLQRLSPLNFAPMVTAPTVVLVGMADGVATPESVITVYERLRGPKTVIPLEGAEHCPLSDLPGGEQALSGAAPGDATDPPQP